MHWFRYYGTMSKTILEIDPGYPNEGIYIIQSPDLGDWDAEQISEVPDDFELISDHEAILCDLPQPDMGNWRIRDGRSHG